MALLSWQAEKDRFFYVNRCTCENLRGDVTAAVLSQLLPKTLSLLRPMGTPGVVDATGKAPADGPFLAAARTRAILSELIAADSEAHAAHARVRGVSEAYLRTCGAPRAPPCSATPVWTD